MPMNSAWTEHKSWRVTAMPLQMPGTRKRRWWWDYLLVAGFIVAVSGIAVLIELVCK
jgi:hypothetical protein